jgi:hypothetical protein
MLHLASSRKRRAGRRAGAAAAAVTAAVVLSGCYGIAGQAGTQLDVVGDVDVTTSLCTHPFDGTSDADGCVTDGAPIGTSQLFYAYQVPDGVTAPASLTAGGSLATVSFTKDSEYAAIVQDQSPATDGTHWVSYRSSEVPAQPNTPQRVDASVKAHFGVAGLGDTPFTIRTVEAYRWTRPADEANGLAAWALDRPIVCGNPQPSYNSSTDATSCDESAWPRPVSAPLPVPVPGPGSGPSIESVETTPTTPAPLVQTIALNRLTVGAPTDVAGVTAGGTVAVNFPTKSTLGDPAVPASVPIAADSELPGATIVAPNTLALGGTGSVELAVSVPATTPAGDYKVTVQAGERSGAQVREATVHVSAPVVATTPAPAATAPAPAPELTIPQKLAKSAQDLAAALSAPAVGKQLREGGATLPITMPTRGTVRVSLLGKAKKKGAKAPVLAVGTARSADGSVTDVKLHRTADGKRILGSGKVTVHGTLVVRLWGPTGKTVSTPVTITLG